MGLNERETFVVRTKMMGMSINESLEYMKTKDHEISETTYYRTLGTISGETLKYLNQIAQNFKEEFLNEMLELDEIKKLMWEQYIECDDAIKKVSILNSIVSLKPYKSAYIEASKRMMERYVIEESNHEKNLNFTHS